MSSKVAEADCNQETNEASGIYTWVISADTVYSDSLVAEVFGFGEREARNGLPLGDYLARIHADDLPRVAEAIQATVLSGRPYSEQYRVCRPDGSMVQITAFGSCFHDKTGAPSHYSGILFPADAAATGNDNAVVGHLLAAHELAYCSGRIDLADRIVDLLVEAGWQDAGDDAAAPEQLH